MATRYRCYQFSWGFMTYDTETETAPESGFIGGPFQVNHDEADMIQEGAMIRLNDEGDDVIVYWPEVQE